jgi:hypothetical protein
MMPCWLWSSQGSHVDTGDWNTVRKVFEKAKVLFGTPERLLNPSSPDDTFTGNVHSAMDQYERERLKVRTMGGIREAVRQGRYFAANAPFGYRMENGIVLANEAEAAVVKRIFDMALHGGTIRSISLQLTAEGVPSPMTMRGDVRQGKGWRLGTVARILHNPIYTGVATWGKTQRVDKKAVVPRPISERLQVKVPILIDVGQFATAQEAIKRNTKFSLNNQKRTYLLKGLFFCTCGHRMSGTAWHGRRRYICIGREVDHSCKQSGLDADTLEFMTLLEVAGALLHPEAVMRLATEQRGQFGKRDEAGVRLDSLNAQLAKVPEARSRLIDAYTEGTLSKPEFKEKVAALDERRARLEQERESLQTSLGQVQADEVDAARLAELLAKHRNNLSRLPRVTTKEQVEIVLAVLKCVSIQKDGSLRFDAVVPLNLPGERSTLVPHCA